ncbi:hypothetical protein C8K44_12916 [Aminobacter sp. AP02]|nr:hypothetical protein C8K44_12916 [Aminobacter sp. AP02]
MGITLQIESCPAANDKAMVEERLERNSDLLPAQQSAGASIS